MMKANELIPEEFQWPRQPEAAALVETWINQATRRSPRIERLALRMRDETGTRLLDWLDHLSLPQTNDLERQIADVGFVADRSDALGCVWRHPRAIFPAVLVTNSDRPLRLGVKVDNVVDFLSAQMVDDRTPIIGEPASRFRWAIASDENGAQLAAVERHGYRGFEVIETRCATSQSSLRHLEAFRRRRRECSSDEEGFAHTQSLIGKAIADLGRDWACDLFFIAEREYWQRRNRAAKIQKARQDSLGLGWANHDHHTYRSSRQNFTRLVASLELLGFECRERFYGGHGAGWGAQVLEQPICGITVFADVDMSVDEVAGDFAHEPLPRRDKLGTVGLWCQLHGEAFLQAGLHHLECQFDFSRSQSQLQPAGVPTMKPFTDFAYLKQAFTEGEVWPVAPSRIDAALAAGFITHADAERFRTQGAVGSHLEILQRDEGYKGFNQTGISEIILATDPRLLDVGH